MTRSFRGVETHQLGNVLRHLGHVGNDGLVWWVVLGLVFDPELESFARLTSVYMFQGERGWTGWTQFNQPMFEVCSCVWISLFFLEFLIYRRLVIYPIKYHNDPHFAWLTSHNFDGTHSDMQGSVTYWVEISQHQLLWVKGQGMLLDKSNQKFKIRQKATA